MGDIAIKISDVHLAFGKNRVLRGVSGQSLFWGEMDVESRRS